MICQLDVMLDILYRIQFVISLYWHQISNWLLYQMSFRLIWRIEQNRSLKHMGKVLMNPLGLKYNHDKTKCNKTVWYFKGRLPTFVYCCYSGQLQLSKGRRDFWFAQAGCTVNGGHLAMVSPDELQTSELKVKLNGYVHIGNAWLEMILNR